MAKKKTSIEKRVRARDFGDNLKIRKKYGEASRINVKEPWERRYWGIRKVRKKSTKKKKK